MVLVTLLLVACGRPQEGLAGPGQVNGSSSTGSMTTVAATGEHVRFFDSMHGAIYDQHSLRVTADGGASWQDRTPVEVSSAMDHASIQVLDAQHAWAAVDNGDGSVRLLRTTDGTSWSTFALQLGAAAGVARRLRGLWFSDALHGFLVAHVPSSTLYDDGAVFVTTDGGSTWVQQAAPGGDVASFGSAILGWMVVGPGVPRLMVTADGARTWSEAHLLPPSGSTDRLVHISPPAGPPSGPFVTFVEYNDANGVTDVEQPYSSSDGISWTPASSAIPVGSASGNDVAISGAGPSTFLAAMGSVVYRSTDGAATWKSAAPSWAALDPASSSPGGASFRVVSPTFVDAGDGWAILESSHCAAYKSGCSDAARLIRTGDGGFTWQGA